MDRGRLQFTPYRSVNITNKGTQLTVTVNDPSKTPGIATRYIKVKTNQYYQIKFDCDTYGNTVYLVCFDKNRNIIGNKIYFDPHNTLHNIVFKNIHSPFISISIFFKEPNKDDKFTLKKFSIVPCASPKPKPKIEHKPEPKPEHDAKSEAKSEQKNTEAEPESVQGTKPKRKPLIPIPLSNLTKKLSDKKLKKILITSTQYPGYGGAATNAYELIKYLAKKRTISVYGCFFDNSAVRNKVDVDPDKTHCVCIGNSLRYDRYIDGGYLREEGNTTHSNIKKKIIKYFDGEPDIIVAFNYMAPIISKYMFRNKPVIYAVTGSTYLTSKPMTVKKFMGENIDFTTRNIMELVCLGLCDKIMFNTSIIKNIFHKLYPEYTHKFIDKPVDLTKISINSFISSDEPRIYDIVTIMSRFDRAIKNTEFIKKIFNRLKGLNKLAIGDKSQEILGDCPNTTCLPLMSNSQVQKYLQQSKVVLMPSLFESASIVVRESVRNGALVITSRNIGLSDRLSDIFVCDTVDNVEEWIHKINMFINNFDVLNQMDTMDYDEKEDNIITQINRYIDFNTNEKFAVLVVSVDTPGVGGSATNAYRIIKNLRMDPKYNVVGLFIDSTDGDPDPDGIGGIVKLDISKEDDNLLEVCKNDLIEKLGTDKLQVTFAKNYKSVIICRKLFPDTQIIFSPSGSRYYSLYCHRNEKFMSYEELYETVTDKSIDLNYARDQTVWQYLKDDQHLETIAVEQCDMCVNNSKLTEDLYKKLYHSYNHKFGGVVSLSNICDMSKLKNKKIYDVAFMCYSWKRKIKNRDVVAGIINHPDMKDKKILIVGMYNRYIQRDNKNITLIDNCPQTQMNELLSKCKVYVMPSYYDSNPNSMVESSLSGCVCVTSLNVGQHIYIPDSFVVKDFYNVEEWVDKVKLGLSHPKKFVYRGPSTAEVMLQLKNNIERCMYVPDTKKKIGIGIYKVPAIWNESVYHNNPEFKFVRNSFDAEFVMPIIEFDIFYKLFSVVSFELECDEFHYLIGEDGLANTVCYHVSDISPNISNVYIWRVKCLSDLMKFDYGDYYFLRGTYHNVYRDLLQNSTAKTIHYRATAITTFKKPEPVDVRYDLVIHDGREDILKVYYPCSKLLKFRKFANQSFFYKNLERDYHGCFVATHNQTTKNHDLFVELIKYLEKKQKVTKLIYIGDHTKLACFKKLNIPNLKYVTLDTFERLPREELVNIFNRSKINLLFSGRDCNPRVITESLSCGCFNVALDTLSDGKWVFDGFFGELVGDITVPIVRKRSHSTSYKPDDKLFAKFDEFIRKDYDHCEISKKTYESFNLRNNVELILKHLKTDAVLKNLAKKFGSPINSTQKLVTASSQL